MSEDKYRRQVSSNDAQDKMSSYFKQQSSTSSLPKKEAPKPSESNLYNFSDVTEQRQEENEEDLAIMSVFGLAEGNNDSVPSPLKEPIRKPQQQPPKPTSQQSKQRPASVKRPHQFNKLEESEKEKVFLGVYDENLKLKEYQRKQEDQYGQMEVKFRTMEKQMKSLKGQFAVGKGADTRPQETEKDNEQMMRLKYQMEQQQKENENLKQKIMALSNAHKIVSAKQAPKRKLVTPQTASEQPDYRKSGGVGDGQIKDLLKLNDMLKKRCLEQESQIRSMQAMMNSKIVSNKELSDKNSTFVTLKERYEKMESHLTAQRNQLDDERKRQSEIMQLLRDEREKNHQLEDQVRSLELMAKSAADLQADLMECKRQKNELEEKLKILMESPFFKDYNERATVAAKMKGMENEQIKNATELRNLRDLNARLDTENAIRRQELQEAQTELKKKYEECKEYQMQLSERDKQLAPFKDLAYWDNDQFLKVLGNLKWTGDDPAWRKIEFIDRTYLDSDDPNVLRKEIEHLKLEKGELAAHLEKTQTLLRTRQDIEAEKDRLHKVELDKVTLQLRAATAKCNELAKIADLHAQSKQARTLYEAEGVKYDDTISIFSVDPTEDDQLQPGENFFDFYLGEAQLDANGLMQSYAQVNPSGGTLDPAALLTFLTIDFYDHETQHTSVSEGTNCMFNLQVSFKVTGDAPFIQYLESGYLKVELYMSQGSDAIRLATGLLSLRELILGNRTEGVSKVISGHITLNGYNNQFVGIVVFKGRMRQPISQIIKWLKDQRELDIQEQEEMTNIVAVRKRKLVVVIDKATQLPPRSNSFIYYSLDNKDFNTNTQPGSTPRWDYRMVHEIVYNEEFVNLLKRQPLEFYLIDDNQPLTSELQSDKLGMCVLEIHQLIQGEIIDMAAEIKNDEGERVGSLYVKVFWYESREDDIAPQQGQGLIQQSWEEQFTNRIASEARSRGLNSRQTFRMLDFDDDKVISLEDFQNGLKNILGIKANAQELNLYYQKLPQPLNQQSFDSVFRNIIGLQADENQSMIMGGQPDLSQINRIVNFNTQQLSLSQERIEVVRRSINDIFQARMRKGKSRSDIFNEIDSIKPDGYISVSELWGWLRYQGLRLSEEEVSQFLSQYMDQDRDNQINVKEFFNYILGGMSESAPGGRSTVKQQTFLGRTMNYENQYEIIQNALDAILQFAKQNQYTLMKVREIMDSNRNGFIERDELSQFLIGCGINFSHQELGRLIDFFDVNKDRLISIQEFADALNYQNKNKNMIKTNNSFDGVSNYIVGYLISYMKKMKRTMPQLFNEIDLNGDGYLSRQEMRDIFKQKIIVPLDNEEFETFFKHFDENNDDKISIKEFVTVIQPAIQKIDGSLAPKQPTTNDRLQTGQIMKKIEEILAVHQRSIMQAMELKEDPKYPMFVSPQNFRQVLQALSVGFTNNDIDKILDEVVQKNQAGLVNYVNFVDLAKPKRASQLFDQTSVSGFGSMSQMDQQRAISKSKEVFSKISRNIKRMNLTKQQVFKTFDLDGDGQIQKEEMREVFAKMKLRVTANEVDMIFSTLDANNEEHIKIDEFLKWIDI